MGSRSAEPASARSASGRARGVLVLVAPSLLFVAIYARSLDYELVWSDVSEIGHGTLVRPPGRLLDAFSEPMHANLDARLASLPQPYYRPLQVVLVSVLHARFGASPRAYRAVSLLLGAITLALFTALAWCLFGRPAPALAAGCLAAAHPAGLEVHVWIAGISEALASCLWMASLLLSLAGLRARSTRGRVGWLALAGAALLLALLSKEKPAAAPALLLALAASEAVRGRTGSAASRAPAPGFAAAAAAAIAVQGALAAFYTLVWRPRMASSPFAAGWIGGEPLAHLASSLAIWPQALGWLVLPLHSTTSDAVRIVTSPLAPPALLGAGLAVASLAAWFVLLRRGHALPALGLAWVWIAYLPTSNLVPLLHARAERHMFFSVFGLALLAAWLGPRLVRPVPAAARRWLAPALAVACVAFLAQRTLARQPDWRSTLTLMRADVARDPAHREGRLHLAHALAEAGLLDEAARHAGLLVAGDPAFRGTRSYLRPVEAHELACDIDLRRGRAAAAALRIEELARRASPLAREPSLRLCLAHARAALGRPRAALPIYLELLAEQPGDPDPALAMSIARVYTKMSRPVEARAWLDRVERNALEPDALAEYLRLRRRTRPRR